MIQFEIDDAQLWKRVQDGDREAFRSIVARRQAMISAVAFSILGDFAASQDVAQETFWSAWKQRALVHDPTRVRQWLCGIARNLSRMWLRKNASHSEQIHDGLADRSTASVEPIDQSISKEEAALVWSSLEQLSEDSRETLVLFYREGQSTKEVAETLGIGQDAVKQRLSRGRAALREQVSLLIEGVLEKSKPGTSFTTKVMAGIAGVGVAMRDELVVAATATASTAVSKVGAVVVSKALSTAAFGGSMGAIIGSLVGVFGGIGGAYFGAWASSEFAPTRTEREYLRKEGGKIFFLAIAFALSLLLSTLLLYIPQGALWYGIVVSVASIGYAVAIGRLSIQVQKRVNEIRASVNPESDPNPSKWKAVLTNNGKQKLVGKQYTSQWRFLGLPLIDIQLADPSTNKPRIACGWIAIGDRAYGGLVAIGGLAVGTISFGGFAIGGASCGGFSLGGVALGGLTAGLIALGGLGLGYQAAGGGALGYDAAGGAAIGYHTAYGGLAIASEFAQGGSASAAHANDELAKEAVEASFPKLAMDWYRDNQILSLAILIAIALVPALSANLFYSRRPIDSP